MNSAVLSPPVALPSSDAFSPAHSVSDTRCHRSARSPASEAGPCAASAPGALTASTNAAGIAQSLPSLSSSASDPGSVGQVPALRHRPRRSERAHRDPIGVRRCITLLQCHRLSFPPLRASAVRFHPRQTLDHVPVMRLELSSLRHSTEGAEHLIIAARMLGASDSQLSRSGAGRHARLPRLERTMSWRPRAFSRAFCGFEQRFRVGPSLGSGTPALP
ncbi:hypothetical protein PI125_g7986 [Phytophthora idaei]|nr:hypothetical protein PI125_g7986 [Phytophthora idaei]